MDNIPFDVSSSTNQNALGDLEARKQQGWKIVDVVRDPNDSNVMLVVIRQPSFQPSDATS
jgi:hypothetical protein